MRINVPSIYYTQLYIRFATEKPHHIKIGCRKGYASKKKKKNKPERSSALGPIEIRRQTNPRLSASGDDYKGPDTKAIEGSATNQND